MATWNVSSTPSLTGLCRRLASLRNGRRGRCKGLAQARLWRATKGWGCVSRRSATGGAPRFAPRPLPPEHGSGRGAYVNTRGNNSRCRRPRHCPSVKTPCRLDTYNIYVDNLQHAAAPPTRSLPPSSPNALIGTYISTISLPAP